jgi:signal transduction histidine kinase
MSRHALVRLKWVATIIPAVTVFLYETVRHSLLAHLLPTTYGNLIVGVIALILAYGFSTAIFRVVERLQMGELARSREVVTLTAIVQERERLSRELHDGLAQLVAYVLLRLDTVRELVDTGRRKEALAELDHLHAAADDLYADIRESIAGLRIRVAEMGLSAALREYLDTFEERQGLAVDLRVEGLPPVLSPLVGFQLLRIVQEALANVRKHARATHAWVALTCPEPRLLRLVIGDNGRGFDPAAHPDGQRSFGLATMRERAASLGGALRVESRPGAGARVIVTVPFRDGKGRGNDGTLAGAAR